MAELVVRLQLKEEADPEEVSDLLMGLLMNHKHVAEATVLPPADDAQEERLKTLIQVSGPLPSLEETTRLYVRLGPDVRQQVAPQQFSMLSSFLRHGPQRGKSVMAVLVKDDPATWQMTSYDSFRGAYSRLRMLMQNTPFPLISRPGTFGFKAQEALTRQGRRVRGRKLEDEV